jgi:transcriptional regulator
MYVAPACHEDDLAALHGTMRDARLENLVTATAEGMTATPLPLFMRPDAYVSLSWYPSKLEHQKVVPT